MDLNIIDGQYVKWSGCEAMSKTAKPEAFVHFTWIMDLGTVYGRKDFVIGSL